MVKNVLNGHPKEAAARFISARCMKRFNVTASRSWLRPGFLAYAVSSPPRKINLQLRRLRGEMDRTSSAQAKAIEMQEKVDALTSQAQGQTRAKEEARAEVFIC